MARKKIFRGTTTKNQDEETPEKNIVTNIPVENVEEAKLEKNESIDFRERMKGLEKKHISFVESLNKTNFETNYGLWKAQLNYDLEFRSAYNAGEESSKLGEITKTHENSHLDLRKKNRDRKKELEDTYLQELKDEWNDLQKSGLDYNQLQELGFYFWNLTSEAVNMKGFY